MVLHFRPHKGGIENGILNLFLSAAKFHLLLPPVKSLSLLNILYSHATFELSLRFKSKVV